MKIVYDRIVTTQPRIGEMYEINFEIMLYPYELHFGGMRSTCVVVVVFDSLTYRFSHV